VWWPLADHRCGNLHLAKIAVLPQFLRRSRILEQNSINLEGVKLAGPVAINSLANAGDKVSQLGLVVFRDHRSRCPSLRLV
jgi:hypothetical protein